VSDHGRDVQKMRRIENGRRERLLSEDARGDPETLRDRRHAAEGVARVIPCLCTISASVILAFASFCILTIYVSQNLDFLIWSLPVQAGMSNIKGSAE